MADESYDWMYDLPDTGGGVMRDESGTYVGSGPETAGNGGGYRSSGGPTSYSSGYEGPTQYRPTVDPFANWDSSFSRGGSVGAAPSGGAGGGPRGMAAMQPQMIQMGSPERTAYDRYMKLLSDPSAMGQDPAYKFLFNQGESALKRSLAAKRLMYSGKSLADTQAFGEGMAADYMNKMLPNYQAGAREELNRFMGPAGLAPRYQQGNNATISQAGSQQAAQDLAPQLSQAYMSMLNGGGSSRASMPTLPAGPSFGGRSSGYTPTPDYSTPSYAPRLASAYGLDDVVDNMWG